MFIPYSPNSVEEAVSLARRIDAAQVLLDLPDKEVRQECPYPMIPARSLEVDTDDEAVDENEFSDEIETRSVALRPGFRIAWK